MKFGRLAVNSKIRSDNLIILILLIFISRIPFLLSGYGSDGDAWRIAYNASKIWETCTYSISRFPGFPLYELMITPFVALGGSIFSNTVTLIVFCFGVIIFDKILILLNIESRRIILWTFAFIPLLWKSSTTTLDYIWGLTFILFAYYLFLNHKYASSAVVIGLAAATRLTNIIFILPLFFLIEREGRWKNIIIISFISIVSAFLFYLPVIFRSGALEDLQIYIADIRHYLFIQQSAFFIYRGIYSVGLLGFIAILICSYLSRNKIKELIQARDKYFISMMAAIVIMFILFFVLADEREYLIPIIPFLLLAIGMILPRKYIIITSVCLLSYAFINIDIIEHNFSKQKPRLSLTAGYVIKDYIERTKLLDWRVKVASHPFRDSSIVMIGAGPLYFYENLLVQHTDAEKKLFPDRDSTGEINIYKTYPEKSPSRLLSRNVFFVYALCRPESDTFLERGYHLYYLADKKEYLESCVRYDLSTKAEPLDLQILGQ
ncbi:MAG: hypothetical protein HZB59_04935 [Ignavibacteriales bacterium]|nr:hypothetical protein [Ignavibacteriales bacterium]